MNLDALLGEADPAAQNVLLRWAYGRRLLVDPDATTPAGHLRHGVMEQLTGRPTPNPGKRTRKPRVLSEELLRDLDDIQARIEATSRPQSRTKQADDPGYLYVVRFSSGVIKVGKTISPETRLANHASRARVHKTTITESWVSEVHPDHSMTERQLIKFCAYRGSRISGEYFTDISFEDAREYARQIVGDRLSAAAGMRGVRT